MDKWLKQYLDNYNGVSKEAKEIKDFLKETYNGASYIPWATMERLTYTQDPNASFEVLKTNEGNIVWTDSFENYNEVSNKEGLVNGTKALVVSHFVKVRLIFMGKEFIEEYPIQDQDYSALKIYNQNAVNKSIKRALAKVASRATGLGLKLYEAKDLQFEEDKEEKRPVIKQKETNKNKETKTLEEDLIDNMSSDKNVDNSLISFIRESDKEKMTKALRSINTTIVKQYGFSLSLEDSDEELKEKLSKFNNLDKFKSALSNMLK